MTADTGMPIGKSLALGRTEVYREILAVYKGTSDSFDTLFGAEAGEEYWGRHYLFWHRGKPLALIYEVFSPSLEKYLGPRVLE
jgi:chorismate lyase